MKVTSKVECGIIVLLDIAVNSHINNVVKLNSISKRNNISVKYLEQIVPLLKRANFLRSVQGYNGGYVLSRDPADISLNEIVNALDNTIFAASEFNDKLENIANKAIAECLWRPVNNFLQEFSTKITLKDLAGKYSEMQIEQFEPMYYI